MNDTSASTSEFTQHEPCPKCGSRDALARYTDGHAHCFACSHYEHGDGSTSTQRKPTVSKDFNPIFGEYRALIKRGISEETCRHFGYTVGQRHGVNVHIAPYYKGGELVAQHYRTPDKDFPWSGNVKGIELFGQHLWRDGGKKVVITEGEMDAMSLSQVQGNKWPVVSIPTGSNGAAKAIKDNIEWLEKFEEVVLMFDMDTPGKEAAAECSPLLTPGKCKVATLPLKDANEMLQANRGKELIDAIWGAKVYRPDGVIAIEDVIAEAAEDVPDGLPWFLPALTEATYGRRAGEIYAFGAGTGVGKTDLFTQSIAYDLLTLKLKVGVLYLEQPKVETARRIAGKAVGKILHVPGKSTKEERISALKLISETNSLFLYDSFGSAEWDVIKAKIRYMVVGLDCKHIYLDHLTALVASEEDERKTLDRIMAEMAALALELKCVIHFISHLTRPEGKPHEEGGRVQIKNFRGSNAIGMWSHFMFGLERNQQAQEEADRKSTLRVLKDRNTGQATGKTILLDYCPTTGMISESTESPFTPHRPTTGTSTNTEF